jgi:DNA-binding transcriptional LysR family regulator
VTFTGLEGAREWTFRSGRKIERLTVRSRLAVNTAEAAAEAATANVGVARLLCYPVSRAVLDGRLKLAPRKFEPPPLRVSLVSVDARLAPRKLKAFMDFVAPRSQRAGNTAPKRRGSSKPEIAAAQIDGWSPASRQIRK